MNILACLPFLELKHKVRWADMIYMNVMVIPVVLCRGWTWHPYAAPVLASVTLLIWGFFYNKHIYIY